MESKPVRSGETGQGRRPQARTLAAAGLALLAAVFAALNLDEVDVNWILGTWSTPLIVVIALSLVIGAALGYLVGRRAG
jgi:uncharacterized integral membrane protein